jgi:hypothetical protein
MIRDPRVGRAVRLRHVKGERGVTRALDGTPAVVTAVWKYAGGLVRIHVRVGYGDQRQNLSCSIRQVDFRP